MSSVADVAAYCYKWIGWIGTGWSPGEVKYRAAYVANNTS